MGSIILMAASDSKGSAYVVSVYSLIAFVSLCSFGLLHALSGNVRLGAIEISGGLLLLLNVILLRTTRNVVVARFGFMLVMLLELVVMLVTGGTDGTGIFWFFVFPVGAFFLTGKRQGLWWMAALSVAILMILVLIEFDLISIAYSLVTIRQLLLALLAISIGIYVYQSTREDLATQSHETSTALREAQIKAETILENINEGVVATDTDGRVVACNRAAEDMLGWSFDELAGKPFVQMVPMLDAHGNTISLEDRPLHQVLGQKTPSAIATLIYTRKDGSTFPAAIVDRMIVIDGKMQGAIATFHDITEELALDRSKSEFVTLASHQLRTPISSIAWLSELLLNGDSGKLQPEQAEQVAQIYQSNQRMAALVAALLTVSSLELQNLPVRPEPVDLRALSREVLQDQLTVLSASKKLQITQRYDSSLTEVPYDPSIIKIILQNLLANAIKYTQDNGHITISIRPSDEKLATDVHNILIEVKDTGFGIPKGQQAAVFSKMFRAENIKHKDTDGTGLGLFIVKTVTEYVGGRMWFHSVENKGSTFSVLLPGSGMVAK